MKLLICLLLALSTAIAGELSGLKTYDGKDVNTKDAKAVLVVNIATRCGYTGQLDGLQKLYKSYASKGLLVLGVPSNEFGGQSPEDNQGIGKFCRMKYGVEFPILKRASVLAKTSKGDKKSTLVSDLVKQSGEGEIKWNFEKFLVSKDGKLLKRFRSSTTPESDEMKKAIEGVL